MVKCAELFEKIEQSEKEYIDFWADICRIESPTEYKEGVDKVGAYVAEKARLKGWEVEIQKQNVSGDCICIAMNPEAQGQPVCFSGHMDTVHPIGYFGEEIVTFDDEKIYGPGVLDCKGGIAASFMAMAALQECGFKSRPIKLLLQSDEEISSKTSNKTTVQFMAEKSKDCIAFLNAEGHNAGKVTIIRKGISRYLLEVTGKAAHSSRCYNGVSAVTEAAHKIIELEKMKDEHGLTCNCGIISGGTAENTVPETCTLTADIRFNDNEAMNQADRIVEEIANKSFMVGTTCRVTLKSRRPAMELTDKNIELLDKINKIYKENGLPVLEKNKSTGGSDAADMTSYGIPCLDSFGTEGGNIHSRNEWAKLSSLVESAKRLASVAYCI